MATVSAAAPRALDRSRSLEYAGLIERDFPRHAWTGWPLTIHYWLMSYAWAIGVLAVAGILWVAEYFCGVLRTPTSTGDTGRLAVRLMGFAHYTVAIYFLFTSQKVRSLRSMLWLGAFFVGALGLCWLFYATGGYRNQIAVISLSIFFVAHALRDEVFFYRQRSGRAIRDDEYPHVFRMSVWLQFAGLAVAGAIIYPIYFYGFLWVPGHRQVSDFLDHVVFSGSLSQASKMSTLAAPMLLLAGGFVAAVHRGHPGGIVRLLRSHWPLTVVLACTLVIVASSAFLTAGVVTIVIIIHFTGWYIFAARRLAEQPPQASQGITWRTPNEWFKRTYTGFNVFHGGLVVFFSGLILFNHYAAPDTPTCSSPVGSWTTRSLSSWISRRSPTGRSSISRSRSLRFRNRSAANSEPHERESGAALGEEKRAVGGHSRLTHASSHRARSPLWPRLDRFSRLILIFLVSPRASRGLFILDNSLRATM